MEYEKITAVPVQKVPVPMHTPKLDVCMHFVWNCKLTQIAINMHICMSSQQKHLVYTMGLEVPKLVYIF